MKHRLGREFIDLVLLRGISTEPVGAQLVMALAWLALFGPFVLMALWLLGIWP